VTPDFRERFVAGVDLFNSRSFWEAHEAWEEIWLHDSSPARLFLQGLIQLAAAYHHLKRGTFPGGVRLFNAAFEKLSDYPPLYLGVERDTLLTAARQHQRWASEQMKRGGDSSTARLDPEEYPRIGLTRDFETRLPR
jgi:predicted metal-dependent hydrolase